MKKIYIFLAALVLITGCDDGDMSFKALDFSQFSLPARCNDDSNTVYMTNGSEALIFGLPPSLFTNTAREQTIAVGTGTSYNMIYRNYSGSVNRSTLCESSGTPNVLEQWGGSGNLSIISTARYDDNTGKLLGYSHDITLVTATFSNNGQEVTIVDNFLGTMTTNYDIDFEFDELPNSNPDLDLPYYPRPCTNDSSVLYKIVGDEALQLIIPPSYFATNEAQTIQLNNDDDDVEFYFLKYTLPVDVSFICSPSQTHPSREQLWRAGGGTLEITYEADADNVFKHVIRFRNLVLINYDNEDEVYTPLDNDTNPGYYYFGPHPTL